MIPTGGDGNSHVKYVAKGKIEISANGTKTLFSSEGMTVTGSLSVTQDLNLINGGRPVSAVFYKNRLLQAERAEMTASVVHTGSVAGLYKVYKSVPLFGSGSVLGFSLICDDSVVAVAAVTASVMIDGINVGTPLIMTTGSRALVSYAKDTYTFSGTQVLGVSITGSAEYLTDLAASASFVASVLVEC